MVKTSVALTKALTTLSEPRKLSPPVRLVALVLGTLLALVTTGLASAAIWLDEPPRAWNVAGAAVPAAPTAEVLVPENCRARERAPADTEEQQLANAKWRLVDFWATQRQGRLTIVTATAGYDGMCRPATYNAFAFVDGKFAGTLSPVPMVSRLDGALFTIPTILPDGKVETVFIRYAAKDPLCCPSLPRSRVIYQLAGAAGSQVLAPEKIEKIVEPTKLPATGEIPLLPIALIGSLALLAGALLRLETR